MAQVRIYLLVMIGVAIFVVWAAHAITFPRFDFNSGRGPQLAEIDFNFFSKGIRKSYISQGYGKTYFALWSYRGSWHNGIDIVAQTGAPVHSATAGVALATGNQDNYCYKRAFGKFIVIKNSGDNKTVMYAHLSKIFVEEGALVNPGDVIGNVGQTGFATAPHLHFSVFSAASFSLPVRNNCGPYPTGKDSDPIPYLEALNKKASAVAQK